MSGLVLATSLNPDDPQIKARAAHNRALAEELRAKVAQAALGGNEKSRERHTARGKLLPRERVERLLDPGSPLLEVGQLGGLRRLWRGYSRRGSSPRLAGCQAAPA